eukprot:gene12392-6059_t
MGRDCHECKNYWTWGNLHKCCQCENYICDFCVEAINEFNPYNNHELYIFCNDCHHGNHECFIIISEHGCSFAKTQKKNPELISIVDKFTVDLPRSFGVQSQFLKKKRDKYISKTYLKNVTKKAIKLWGNFTKPINLHIGITKLLNNYDFAREIKEKLHPTNSTKYEINYGFEKGLEETIYIFFGVFSYCNIYIISITITPNS